MSLKSIHLEEFSENKDISNCNLSLSPLAIPLNEWILADFNKIWQSKVTKI